jgi:hypothetical protein
VRKSVLPFIQLRPVEACHEFTIFCSLALSSIGLWWQ